MSPEGCNFDKVGGEHFRFKQQHGLYGVPNGLVCIDCEMGSREMKGGF